MVTENTDNTSGKSATSPHAPPEGANGQPGGGVGGDVALAPLRDLALECLPDAALVVDARTGALRGNRLARELFGRDHLGHTLEHWLAHHRLHLDDRGQRCPPARMPLVNALRGAQIDDVELLAVDEHSRAQVWLDVRARPLWGDDGRVRGAVAVFRNVTRHKIIEATLAQHRRELEEQHQRQSALADMELAIIEPNELQAVLDRIVRLTERLLPASSAAIVLWDDETSSFAIPASTAPRHGTGGTIRSTGGATRWILEHRRPLTVSDAAHDPFQSPLLRAAGFQAYAGVPLVADGQALGVLYALDHLPTSRSQEEIDFMSSLAHRAATAIVRVRLYEQLRRLNASLLASEAELKAHRGKLEQQVKERTEKLAASLERLAVADRLASLGTLAAGLGHDMHNLMFPLRCRLDAIDWRAVPDGLVELLQSVGNTVTYLQQFADGMRQFALDPEDPGAAHSSTVIADWWKQVGPLLRIAVPGQTSIEMILPDDLPPVGIAPHQLTQAVLNLVVNAAEARPRSGRVDVEVRRCGERVRLSVRDDGVGMSEETQRRVFDPFFTTKTRRLSTGLGLSLVHSVVTAAGGAIELESEPGRGTTFTLVLRALPEAAGADGDGAATAAAIVSLADERAGAWMCRLLAMAGYEAHRDAAPDGCVLWVTDADDARLAAARRFLAADPRRRVVVVGVDDGRWSELGATVVGPADSLEALRRAVR